MAAQGKPISKPTSKPPEAGRRVVSIPFKAKNNFWKMMVEKGWAVESENLHKEDARAPSAPEKPLAVEKPKINKITSRDVEILLYDNKIDELVSLASGGYENLALVVDGAIDFIGQTSQKEKQIAKGNCVLMDGYKTQSDASLAREEMAFDLLGRLGEPALPHLKNYLLSKGADKRRSRKIAQFLAACESPRHVRLLIDVYDASANNAYGEKSRLFLEVLEGQSGTIQDEIVGAIGRGQYSQKTEVGLLGVLAELGNPAMLGRYPEFLDTHCEFADQLIRHLMFYGEGGLPALSRAISSERTQHSDKILALYALETIASSDSLEAVLDLIAPGDFSSSEWTELVQAVKKVVVAIGPASLPAIESRLRGEGLTENLTNQALIDFLSVLPCDQSVAVLSQIAASDDYIVRSRAALALGQMKVESALFPLMGLLSDSEELVASRAADALKKNGLIVRLDSLVGGYCNLVRQAPEDVDSGNESVMRYLLTKAPRHKFPSVRKTAAEALGLSKKADAVPILISLLSDDESQVRKSAASALGNNREERAIKHLIKALGDETSPVVEEAAAILKRYHEAMDTQDNDDDIVMNRLIEALSHKKRAVRYNTIQLIMDIGVSPAIPALKRLAREDPDSGVRGKALKALSNHANQNISTLIDALGDSDTLVVELAIAQLQVLEMLGEHAVTAALKSNKKPEVRAGASLALARSGNPNVIENLKNALDDPNKEVRLAVIGDIADLTVRLIGMPLERYDDESQARIRAAHSESAIIPLVKVLEDRDHDIRAAAAQAICRILGSSERGVVTVDAVPHLIGILRSEDEAVRNNVVTLLESILGQCESEDELKEYLSLIEKSSKELRSLWGRAWDKVSRKEAEATENARDICEEFVRLAKEKEHKFNNGQGPYR